MVAIDQHLVQSFADQVTELEARIAGARAELKTLKAELASEGILPAAVLAAMRLNNMKPTRRVAFLKTFDAARTTLELDRQYDLELAEPDDDRDDEVEDFDDSEPPRPDDDDDEDEEGGGDRPVPPQPQPQPQPPTQPPQPPPGAESAPIKRGRGRPRKIREIEPRPARLAPVDQPNGRKVAGRAPPVYQ